MKYYCGAGKTFYLVALSNGESCNSNKVVNSVGHYPTLKAVHVGYVIATHNKNLPRCSKNIVIAEGTKRSWKILTFLL